MRRIPLHFGQHKLNLHQRDKEFELKASSLALGDINLYFITGTPVRDVRSKLEVERVPVEARFFLHERECCCKVREYIFTTRHNKNNDTWIEQIQFSS